MEMRGEHGGQGREPDDEGRVSFDESWAIELGAVEEPAGGVEKPRLVLGELSEEHAVEGEVEEAGDGRGEEDERRERGAGSAGLERRWGQAERP
jgi:hypothetical protein